MLPYVDNETASNSWPLFSKIILRTLNIACTILLLYNVHNYFILRNINAHHYINAHHSVILYLLLHLPCNKDYHLLWLFWLLIAVSNPENSFYSHPPTTRFFFHCLKLLAFKPPQDDFLAQICSKLYNCGSQFPQQLQLYPKKYRKPYLQGEDKMDG